MTKPTGTGNKRFKGRPIIVLAWSLIIVGVAAVAWSIVLVSRHNNTKPPASDLRSKSAPAAVGPSTKAVADYTVAPNLPKYINIPAIKVPTTRIMQLGLTSNNEIATPDNIYDAGWYNRSALPGQSGAMFIYGHVSSWTANGVFYNLKKLRAGDTVVITRGDNKTFTYRVVAIKIYDYQKVDMNQVLAPVDADKPGLNLMTCTGQIIKGTSEFNERLVVFTSLVSS